MAQTTCQAQGRAGPGVGQAEDEVCEDGRYVQAERDQNGQPQDLQDRKRGDPLRLAPQPRTCMSCSATTSDVHAATRGGRTICRATTWPASWPSTAASSSSTSIALNKPVNTTTCAGSACEWACSARSSSPGHADSIHAAGDACWHAGPYLAAWQYHGVDHVALYDRKLPVQVLQNMFGCHWVHARPQAP